MAGSRHLMPFLMGLLLAAAGVSAAVIVPSSLSSTCTATSLADARSATTSDGRTCTIYTQDAKCMTSYDLANQYCGDIGHELAPYTSAPVAAVLQTLVPGQSFTSWLGDKSGSQCPVMTAGGSVVQQSCNQVIRFTCCTKAATTAKSSPPPPTQTSSKKSPPPPPTQTSSKKSPPPPSPSPPGTFTDISIPADVLASTVVGSYNYTLVAIPSKYTRPWAYAKWWCAKRGAVLAPYNDSSSVAAAKSLCSDHGYKCWLNDPSTTPTTNCPLLNAAGSIVGKPCTKNNRWVCRIAKK